MTIRKYSSRSQQTTLTAALTSSATTMSVVSGSALMGGKTLSGTQTYTVVIDPDTALEEIVDVKLYQTGDGNTITIERPIDGSTAQAHSAGAVVRHMAIGRDYQEANDHIKNETIAHGITLANIVLDTETNVITTAMLQDNAVTTAKITDANVTAAKLAADAVTTIKITDANVTTAKIADSAITSAKIADGTIATGDIADSAITTAKIADGAITSAKILDGTIATADIADSAITSAKIADGAIVNTDINATAGIAYTKLSLGGTITSADLVDGTIVASDIANGTITAAKMVTDPYARTNHTGTQTASTISNFDTQVRTSTLNQMAAPTAALDVASQKITSLATPTVGTDASTKAYVDAQITALVGGAPGTLDTLAEIATAISGGGSVINTLVLKAGDTMTGALVLNANPTVALGAATKQYVDTVAGSATAAAASAAAAETTYDNFDDRYLGAKSSAPSVDNDGNALITGALYWNTPGATMYAWTGSAWGSISSTAAIYRYRFTASGGETSISGTDANGFTLSYMVGKEQVYLNGVLLVRTSDYTASNGTSLTSLAALAAGDIVEIITFTSFDLATAIPNTSFTAKGVLLVGTAAGTYAAQTVGTNGQVLTANSAQADGVEWTTIAGYSAPTLGSTSIASGATVANINGLTINSTTIPTSKTLVATDSTATAGTTATAASGLGYMGVPQNATTTGAATVTAADAGKHIYSTATRTVTIDSNANLALPIGTAITFIAATGATVTIAITTDTLLLAGAGTTGSRTLAPFGMATAIKITSTSWIISGNGLS